MVQTHDSGNLRAKDDAGKAVIRFLPTSPKDNIDDERFSHFQLLREYWFKNDATNKWYKELARTTLGADFKDPVSDFNAKEWATGNAAKQDECRKRKQSQHYISNILVVEDPANPENEGKVFLFKYGKAIFDKIQDARFPDDTEDDMIDAFSVEKSYEDDDGNEIYGAAFLLSASKGSNGWRTYEKSKFRKPSDLTDQVDEDKLDEVIESLYPLLEEVDPSKFKTYEELEAIFNTVMDFGGNHDKIETGDAFEDEEEEDDEDQNDLDEDDSSAEDEDLTDSDDDDNIDWENDDED